MVLQVDVEATRAAAGTRRHATCPPHCHPPAKAAYSPPDGVIAGGGRARELPLVTPVLASGRLGLQVGADGLVVDCCRDASA